MIEVNVGPDAITVSNVALEVMEPDVAEIFAVPGAIPLASPWLPGILLMVATLCASDAHVTKLVMF